MAKSLLGGIVHAADPQCRFDRAVFILAHMRCGSTALSNILCSRAEISGYGEAHVAYRAPGDLGRLVVNQALRRAWKPRARFLFDKVLHNRHDAAAPPEFFQAKAIFLCRRPEDTIPSIRRLFTSLGKKQYVTDASAAQYYLDRVGRLGELWQAFPAEHRVGLTYDALMGNTDACLGQVSAIVGLTPPLKNSYRSHSASVRGGGGDPTASAGHTRITQKPKAEQAAPSLELDADLRQRVCDAYLRFVDMIEQDRPALVS